MFGLPQGLRDVFAGTRGRALAIVAVVAITAALGVGFASAPAETLAAPEPVAREAVARRALGGPTEAAFRTPDLDVDGFVEHAKRLAEERRRRAQDLLDRLYPGLAFVTVSVELDPRWERTTEKVQPEIPAVIEDERPEVGSSGSRRRVLEPFAGTREVGMLAPDVRRVSAALLLDESIASDRRKRDSIVAAVAKAIGPVNGQDPDIEVLVDRFPSTVGSAAGAGTEPVVESPGSFGVTAVAAAIALLALTVAWFGLRRRTQGRGSVPEPAVASSEPTDDSTPLDVRSEIEQAIEQDPALISRLVEGWLTEERV